MTVILGIIHYKSVVEEAKWLKMSQMYVLEEQNIFGNQEWDLGSKGENPFKISFFRWRQQFSKPCQQ